MKRKFFSWLILCFVVFAFGTGGCGGSSSDGGSAAGPTHWEDMSGVWVPSEGRILFFSSSGSSTAAFNLNTSAIKSVDVTVAGAEDLYDVIPTSGRIQFTKVSGEYDQDELIFSYERYQGTYSASGATLSRRTSDDGEWISRSIRYFDMDNVTVTIERGYDSAPSIARRRATVKFKRVE